MPSYKADDFIRVMPQTGGVISVIAKRVGCSWHTAKKYIEEFPTVKKAYEAEKRAVDDKAVSNVFKAISDGDLETSKWWLRMKMPDEFKPKSSHEVDVDGVMEIELAWGDDSPLVGEDEDGNGDEEPSE